MDIQAYQDDQHRDGVITLWHSVFGYETAHNEPNLVINKKLAVADGLFWIALDGSSLIGTVMAGYDGHRGWIYSLAVSPKLQKQGLGSKLLARAETALTKRGCVKINLQIAEGNESVEAFYLANGYATEKRISMGKRLHT